MQYTIQRQVGYSEINSQGRLSPDRVIDYFQDVVMQHGRAVNADVYDVGRQGFLWLLAGWNIKIIQPPQLFEEVMVTTNPYDFKGFFGKREFFVFDRNGEKAVEADSKWVLLNIDTHRPVRVTKELVTPYEPMKKISAETFDTSKLKVSENAKQYKEIPVTFDMLDTNSHVNNCEYVRAALKSVNDERYPSELNVEYRKAAVFGDILCPFADINEDGYLIDLRRENGECCAVVEIRYKGNE